MADFEVHGLAGVLQALEALPREVVSKNGGPARAALAKGAKLIRDEARRLVPVDTGAVRDNIVMKRDTNPQRSGANERYRVGVRGGSLTKYSNTKRNRRKNIVGQKYEKQSATFYWRFLEFGTEKMRARPFLRPAFDGKKEAALNTIVETLKTGIDRIAAKLRKGV